MIWCVEDDSSIREIEVYTLNSTGFEARGFADGASFRAALETEKPELVLLDVMLPGEDGVSLLRFLRQTPETRDIRGGFILSKGEVEVNCTFETLVRLRKGEMSGEVAKLLFPEA